MPDTPTSDMVPRAELERIVAEERRKRRRAEWGLLSVVVMVVVGGGALIWWQDRLAERARSRAAEFEAELARLEAAYLARERLTRQAASDAEITRQQRNRDTAERLLKQADEMARDANFADAERTLALAERMLAPGNTDGLKDRIAKQRTDLDTLRKLDQLNAHIAPPPREAKQP